MKEILESGNPDNKIEGSIEKGNAENHKESLDEDLSESSVRQRETVKKDEEELRETREKIEKFEDEDNGIDDLEKSKDISGKMRKEEKVEKVLEEGSFDEKFALLKELKDEQFEFEIKGFMNNLSQKMVDSSSTKEKREDFVGDIVMAIRKAKEEGRLPDDFFEGLDGMISVGSGHGENPFGILKEYMPEGKAILIDSDAAPSKAIAEDGHVMHLGQRFEDVKITTSSQEKNLVEASNFLQLYDDADKVKMVKKMITLAGIGGKIVIVDEIKRPGLSGMQDRIMNKAFNPGQKKYERLDSGEYEKMFEDLGLKAFTSGKKDQYNRGSVLFMLEVTPEAMKQANEE